MYLLKADTPVSGSNRLVSAPATNRRTGWSLNREHNLPSLCTPHLHDRSVLSMPATSAGVTLGT